MKNYDSNKQSNSNIFDELSRTVSAGINSLKQSSNDELNFKDINKKIGFKRKNNDLITSEENKKVNEIEEQKIFNKKMKK